MALKLSIEKEEKVEPAVIEPEVVEPEIERPVNNTGEAYDTDWIDEIMVRKASFDLEPLSNMFAKVHEHIDDMAKQADDLKVIDVATMNEAIGKGTQAKQYINKIEKTRQEVKAPYLAHGKRIDKLSKGVTSRLEAIQESLRVKIRPIMIAEKEKARAIAEKAEKERREAEKDIAQGSPAAPAPPPPAPSAPSGPVKTSTGSADLVKKYTWTVSDIKLVPEKYLTVTASMVNKDVKAGIQIPGIKIEVTEDVAMRAANS